jgi:hypothetical protein
LNIGSKEALIYSIENSPTIVGAISATLMMVSQADNYQPLTLFAQRNELAP